MRLYILRHGEAFPIGERNIVSDAARMLTPRGRDQSRRAGKMLAFLDEEPDLILTSPLVRARETAEFALRKLRGGPELRETGVLGPSGTVREVDGTLRSLKADRVLVVGHEPLLGELVQYYLNGITDPPLALAKGMLVGLEIEGTDGVNGKMKWMLNSGVMKAILRETTEV